ncbi:hypothetical protein [Cellvibrio sp. UBA7661]|uniref:hypothetical protein n=1 Tax=Cellvibrio sp. UBA7661 TaxID=1946311 RepID=UPI002F355253
MPVKHIPDAIWRKVEKELVKAVVATQMPVKESEMIEVLLRKGLEHITEDDYKAMKEKEAK